MLGLDYRLQYHNPRPLPSTAVFAPNSTAELKTALESCDTSRETPEERLKWLREVPTQAVLTRMHSNNWTMPLHSRNPNIQNGVVVETESKRRKRAIQVVHV